MTIMTKLMNALRRDTDRPGPVLAAVAAAVLLAVAALILFGGGGQNAEAAQDDPHAGHDMSGMAMEEGVVQMDPAAARALGVLTVEAEIAPMGRTVRATGQVAYDERRLSTITPKFDGFVERLHVDFTGQAVRRGQPLLEIYSPELVSAQEELLSAIRLSQRLSGSAAPGAEDRTGHLVESARRRLLLWDISPVQVRRLEETGEVRRTMTLHAPSSGFVVEMGIQSGQAVRAGEVIYRLADLSHVWVEAEVYESDIRFVGDGQPVEVVIDAFPDESLSGRVSYIHPDVRADTRTTRVRVDLPNPDGRVRPGMFATMLVDTPVAERAVVVPRDAVLRTGERNIVFVEEAPGRFEIRDVRPGADANGRTQILSGLFAGERVVSRAAFMLDAESRLMDSMGGMEMEGHVH
jgi:membrane fusion protein, copper/silver efflux system